MVGLLPVITAVALDEFTWILFEGPPAITMSPQGGPLPHVGLLTLPPPFMCSEPCLVGCSTRIGIGEVASSTPQRATARTFCLVIPFSIPAKKVGILSVMATRIRAVGATVVGG